MNDWISILEEIPGIEVEVKENPRYSLGELLELYRKYEGEFSANEVLRQNETHGHVEGVGDFDVALWTTHFQLFMESGGNEEELTWLESWLLCDGMGSCGLSDWEASQSDGKAPKQRAPILLLPSSSP